MDLVLVSLLTFLNFSGVSLVELEQVNVCWDKLRTHATETFFEALLTLIRVRCQNSYLSFCET